MIRVVTAEAMRAADAWTIARGTPAGELMERAGRSLAEAAWRRLLRRGEAPGRVVVVAGLGNNAGDGFVAARLLRARGASVRVALAAGGDRLAGDAARALARLRAEAPDVEVAPAPRPSELAELLRPADLALDALLGTGAKGAPRPPIAQAVEALAEAGRPVLAVDLPSGLDADTGRAPGVAVRAEATLCLGALKLGCLTGPDAGLAGEVELGPIGIPEEAYEASGLPAIFALEAADVAARLGARPRSGHKGSFGRVLVVAGSVGYSGAAVLAARGALRGGAGLVAVLTPAPAWPVVASLVPEATVFPGPADGDGRLDADAWAALAPHLARADAVVLGPGLGLGPGPAALVRRIAAEFAGPLVLDADALRLLPAEEVRGRRADGRLTVLTPHAGEMAAVLGTSPAEVESDRAAAARRAAERSGAVVALKGAGTIVAAPGGGPLYVNRT
ncbi:MAG: NAD(P)H-hydrate dehydratase, partial [Clostridia bacterium]|nr:NAD(P)H-hydrate dehydratase [Clostridia bacterium]